MTIKVRDGGNWNIGNIIKVFAEGDWRTAKKASMYSDTYGWIIIYPDAPVNTSTPFVSGTIGVGEVVTLSNVFIWDFTIYRAPDTITYQWQRSLDLIDWNNIAAATSVNYTIQQDDINHYLRCQITASNEKGPTVVNSTSSTKVIDLTYTFEFLKTFGVNTNTFIFLDELSTGGFGDTNSLFAAGRLLVYFFGDWKQFDLWYKTDSTTMRLYHRVYRADRTSRPASPDIEYEVVLTNGSNVADVYVVNPVTTSYITNTTAYQANLTAYKNYNLNNYAAGQRFRVTMNTTTGNTVATVPASTTSPSIFNGWILLNQKQDTTDGTIAFSSGAGQFSPISQNVNGAFNKSNMFFPSTPSILTPSYSTSTSATLSWTGSTANSYSIDVRRSSDNVQVFSTITTSTSVTITNLSAGTSYNISVSPNSRSDLLGQFGFAGNISYTHSQAPSAPTNLTATVVSDSQVNLSWSAPLNNGGAAISGYIIEYKRNIDSTWTVFGTTTEVNTSASIFGLLPSTSYNFRVAAKNINSGYGPYATVNATTNAAATVPTAPTNFTGTAFSNGTGASFTWSAPSSDGGAAITTYEFQRTQSSTPGTSWLNLGQVFSYTASSLTPGTTYYFRVRAVNSAGAGAFSTVILTTPVPTVPGTPSGFSGISSSDGTFITLFWNAPSDGGSPITTYEFQRNQSSTPGPTWLNIGNTTSWVSNNTVPGTLYYFRVRAINSIGTGSTATTTVTANNPPPPTTAPPTTAPPTTAPPTTAPPTTAPPTTKAPASLAPDTKILTSNYGYIEAKYISVGDELVSMDIAEIPIDGSTFNVDNWSSETFTNNGLTTTIVNNIYAREIIGNMIRVNGEWFTDNHNILSEKDGIYKFTPAIYLTTEHKIFDYDVMDWVWVNDILVEENVSEIVMVLDCEPYDVFFTQNSLVYNTREYLN